MWPIPVVELISTVISRHDVKQQDVLRLRVQSGDSKFHLRKHLPARKEDKLFFPTITSDTKGWRQKLEMEERERKDAGSDPGERWRD